jgi:AcrR family transcriptional regulator
MARNDDAKQARQEAAAAARAAQEEARKAIQAAAADARAAEMEARKGIQEALAHARGGQAEARAALEEAIAQARLTHDEIRGMRRGGERRTRRGREPLSRELIVDVAMKQMKSKGLERLTMRSIAVELDTGPASLYVHVRNTAELHGLLLDRILAGIDLDGAGGTWRERIAAILRQYFAVLMDHPEFARSALCVKPSGRHSLAVLERLLALMAEGGVPPRQAAWGVDLLLLWATAGATEHSGGSPEQPDEAQWGMLRMGMATPEAYPQIAALGLDLVSGTGEQRSKWAIEALLTGIAGTERN